MNMREIEINWEGHIKKYQTAAVVFNRPGLGGLRLESPTLITKKGAEVLPKTPFEVDYI